MVYPCSSSANIGRPLPFVVCSGMGMVLYDCYALVRVSVDHREATEKYSTRAEYWLVCATPHVDRVVTFGETSTPAANGRRRGARAAAVGQRYALDASLRWWVSAEIVLAFSFGSCRSGSDLGPHPWRRLRSAFFQAASLSPTRFGLWDFGFRICFGFYFGFWISLQCSAITMR